MNSDYATKLMFVYLQVQLTDFENAAYVVFVVLLTRAILSFKLNFVIPISMVSPFLIAHDKPALGDTVL